MLKVILRQVAIDDLNEIWEYTLVKWSENQADKYCSTEIEVIRILHERMDLKDRIKE